MNNSKLSRVRQARKRAYNWTYRSPAINRGVDVYPAELTKLHHARRSCDVLYYRTRADGNAAREEGVVWFCMLTARRCPTSLLPR